MAFVRYKRTSSIFFEMSKCSAFETLNASTGNNRTIDLNLLFFQAKIERTIKANSKCWMSSWKQWSFRFQQSSIGETLKIWRMMAWLSHVRRRTTPTEGCFVWTSKLQISSLRCQKKEKFIAPPNYKALRCSQYLLLPNHRLVSKCICCCSFEYYFTYGL